VIGIGAFFGIEMMGGGREMDGEEEDAEEEEWRKRRESVSNYAFAGPRARERWMGRRGGDEERTGKGLRKRGVL
jgi:hypothetical protein